MMKDIFKVNNDNVQFSGCDQQGNFIYFDFWTNGHVELILKFKNVTYHLENSESILHRNGNNLFVGCGLRLEVKEPFRKWKIDFRGHLTR